LISQRQAFAKRTFDIALAIVGLLATFWIIALAWMIATIDTQANGLFAQVRVGRGGRLFKVLKIRTMRPPRGNYPDSELPGDWTTVTTASDQRITPFGKFWRKTKIDELPQLINVLLGQMSFVGPRPDVPGFADCLKGEDRIILTMRPGITGPATLKYRHEEEILALVDDPETYNREVIFPDKVHLNKQYVLNWSFWKDIHYIWMTLLRISVPSHEIPTPPKGLDD
jgi:lipopolysaccharide/colanic/teichoic acid biosynthesis glycosyltransferase